MSAVGDWWVDWVAERRSSYLSLAPFSRASIKVAGQGLVVVLILFGGTAALSSDPGGALDITLGSKSPFTAHAPELAVPLALVGWLVVPVLIGSLFAVLAKEQVTREMAGFRDQLEEFRTHYSELRTLGDDADGMWQEDPNSE
jgi:hypothetical protein